MQIVIDISESTITDLKIKQNRTEVDNAVLNGTPLPKGHGRIIDIGKIDEDKIDKDNPIISLTLNGEYIEVVSLDYLNNLSTIIEPDTENEDIEALEQKTDWIPVSERLPEFHKDVLLSLRSLDVEVGFRLETEPYFYCHGDYIEPQNVLAWMPLPEPI